MLGAIIGDIVGSRFESHNIKTREFEFFHPFCRATDDSIMSLAVARAILASRDDYQQLGRLTAESMRELGRLYPNRGYGGMFRKWLKSDAMGAYNSFGNGAAMRISACGFAARTLDEAKTLSLKATEVTHNHPEGLKGAEAAAVCVFLAREGRGNAKIRDYVNKNYYPMDFTLDGIRDRYSFDVTCQGSVPQAIMAFLESTSFEDAVRNAVSIGGDSDTIAAIAGGIAEAGHGIPDAIRQKALTYLDSRLSGILGDFEDAFPSAVGKAAASSAPASDLAPGIMA